jgi:hypothetical protein
VVLTAVTLAPHNLIFGKHQNWEEEMRKEIRFVVTSVIQHRNPQLQGDQTLNLQTNFLVTLPFPRKNPLPPPLENNPDSTMNIIL